MYFHRCNAKTPNNILIKKSNELLNLKCIYSKWSFKRKISGQQDVSVGKKACLQVIWPSWWKERSNSQVILWPRHIHPDACEHMCVHMLTHKRTINNNKATPLYRITKIRNLTPKISFLLLSKKPFYESQLRYSCLGFEPWEVPVWFHRRVRDRSIVPSNLS